MIVVAEAVVGLPLPCRRFLGRLHLRSEARRQWLALYRTVTVGENE
jgi:hypothetical protein